MIKTEEMRGHAGTDFSLRLKPLTSRTGTELFKLVNKFLKVNREEREEIREKMERYMRMGMGRT